MRESRGNKGKSDKSFIPGMWECVGRRLAFNKQHYNKTREISSINPLQSALHNIHKFVFEDVDSFFLILHQEIKFHLMKNRIGTVVSFQEFHEILVSVGLVDASEQEGSDNAEYSDHESIRKKFSENIILPESKDGNKFATIKDLIVACPATKDDSVDAKSGGIEFIFSTRGAVLNIKNCVFIHCHDNDRALPRAGKVLLFGKMESQGINFDNCILRNISINIRQETDALVGQQVLDKGGATSLSFRNVTFLSWNSCLVMFIKPDENPKSEFFNYIHEKTKISFPALPESKIIIEGCYIDVLDVCSKNMVFRGKNIIKNFKLSRMYNFIIFKDILDSAKQSINNMRVSKEYSVSSRLLLPSELNFEIYWGPYQKIKPYAYDLETQTKGPYSELSSWQVHKKVLLYLKRIAEDKQDHFQINSLAREIMICDHEMIKQEPLSLSSWQDRLTLAFNKWVSNYGISWIRPLVWLAFVNFIYATAIVFLVDCDRGWFLTFVNAFNPLYPEPSGYTHAGAVILFVLQKGLFAVMLYEVIRAGRRFTRFSGSN